MHYSCVIWENRVLDLVTPNTLWCLACWKNENTLPVPAACYFVMIEKNAQNKGVTTQPKTRGQMRSGHPCLSRKCSSNNRKNFRASAYMKWTETEVLGPPSSVLPMLNNSGPSGFQANVCPGATYNRCSL